MRILRNNPYAVFRPGGTPFTATFQRVDFYGSTGIPRYAVKAAPVGTAATEITPNFKTLLLSSVFL